MALPDAVMSYTVTHTAGSATTKNVTNLHKYDNSSQVSYDPRSYGCNFRYWREAWKNADFNGVWTRDLAIPPLRYTAGHRRRLRQYWVEAYYLFPVSYVPA